ncbi:hypothetical protein FB645_003174 [Coemansia sp. IMI 203386]|nr:hypothetical protein IWW45_009428 [Coemansia sp. RSA 485]KAJ2704524.1 hypothetical protein FB645_003174 [Coemansia sp. IMI 203386]
MRANKIGIVLALAIVSHVAALPAPAPAPVPQMITNMPALNMTREQWTALYYYLLKIGYFN